MASRAYALVSLVPAMPLRLVFMGTPDFAVPTLKALLGSAHSLAAVYCQPPKPAGRGMALRACPVQQHAERAGVPVLTPLGLRKPEAVAGFAAHQADAAIVVAYGLLLPPAILALPVHGCFNLHPSLLPRWRGAAPLQRTLMAGDKQTAICVMRMEAGLDTGPICLSEPLPLPQSMTAGELHDQAATRGAGLMLRALVQLEREQLVETPQSSEGVTYAAKIEKAETRIDWSRPADAAHDHIRGLSPLPGAWFETAVEGRRERIKVLRSEPAGGQGRPGTLLDDRLLVACGSGAIRLLELQRAGKKPMAAADLLRGLALVTGGSLA